MNIDLYKIAEYARGWERHNAEVEAQRLAEEVELFRPIREFWEAVRDLPIPGKHYDDAPDASIFVYCLEDVCEHKREHRLHKQPLPTALRIGADGLFDPYNWWRVLATRPNGACQGSFPVLRVVGKLPGLSQDVDYTAANAVITAITVWLLRQGVEFPSETPKA